MSAPTIRSRLTAYDRATVEELAADAEAVGLALEPGRRIRNRAVLHGELLDIGTRLRAILIWSRPTGS